MEASHKSRLHPLLTAAAISVSVFSAVGVGTLTGLIPSSRSSSSEAAPASAIAQPEPTPMPAAEPAKQPSIKPVVKKHPAPRPAEPVVYRDFAEPVRIAEAPRPVVPPVALNLGTVESVREVTTPGDGRSGAGAIGGGIAGAVLGNQFGHGTGKSIMTVLGAAGGALAGKEVEKQARATKHWDIVVRLDNGAYQTVSSSTPPFWHAGDRVRMIDGRLQPV